MKKLLWIIGLIIAAQSVSAQILNPVKWSYAAKKISKKEAMLFIKAILDEGWHIYSVNQVPGGPAKTSFRFVPSKEYTLIGKVAEPTPVKKFDKSFDINITYFEGSVIFQQKIRLLSSKCVVNGKVKFMACNDHQCLPPDET